MTASSSTSPDARVSDRYRIEIEVGLNTDSNFYMGLTENLSHGGLFVATHQVHAIGSIIEMTLRVPTSRVPLSVSGRVRWVRQLSDGIEGAPGMGIEFESLSDANLRAISDFLGTRTPLFFELP